MPPATPHRFLPGRRRQASPSKDPRSAPKPAPPALRRPERGDGFDNLTPKARPAQSAQFAHTPRFGYGRPIQPLTVSLQASPSTHLLTEALRASFQRTEDVQEVPEQDDEDDEMLEVQHEVVVETTEMVVEEQPWTRDLPHSPKRRKLDDAPTNHESAFASPARPTFKHPATSASHLLASTAVDDGTAIRRPAFLRPTIAPSEQFEPLPEAFSPHRRGEKFVTGGMAATLQQWIIETGQAAAHSRRGQGYLRGEDYVHKVKVHDVVGHSPMLVRGRQADGTEMRVLLVVDSKEQSKVSSGSVIGIRAPVWGVDVERINWTVGVDWRLLS